MTDPNDERRLLRWVAERGGPAGTINVTGRGGEIGIDDEALPELVGGLTDRGFVEVQDDGDLRLTALGRAMIESADV